MNKAFAKSIICWLLGFLFVAIGVLNSVLVHPVPAAFYILLSALYFPPLTALLDKNFGIRFPFPAQVIVALFVLWGTLAVTDLADILGL